MKEPNQSARRFRFGVFEVDLAQGELRRHGLSVKLQEKPFQMLALLLERAAKVVTREELRQRLWPADTFVDFESNLGAAAYRIRQALGDSADNPRFIETIPRRGYRLIVPVEAVETLSVSPALSEQLAQATHKSVDQIARELGASYLLEGTVRLGDGRVRFTAELVQFRNQTHVWAETYEPSLTDVPQVQSDVAGHVAQSSALELLPSERATLAHVSTVSPQAYESYLKGRYLWNRRMPDELKKSLAYFQQAVGKAPNHPQTHAGLADTYVVLADWFVVAPDEAFPKAKAAATRALEIDEGLAQAHASLAMITWEYGRDPPAAEKEFRRAIELDPQYPTAHQWYAEFLSALGRHDEAIAEMTKARRLAPLSLIINAGIGYVLYYARQYDEAIAACRNTLEMDPGFAPARTYLLWAYQANGMYCEWALERQIAMSLEGRGADAEVFGRAYAAGGVSAARFWTLREQMDRGRRFYVPPYDIATLYAEFGENDQAFGWLEKACKQRDNKLVRIKADPAFDPLRSDQRYKRVLREIGLSS